MFPDRDASTSGLAKRCNRPNLQSVENIIALTLNAFEFSDEVVAEEHDVEIAVAVEGNARGKDRPDA
jgi:hypothetical protein